MRPPARTGWGIALLILLSLLIFSHWFGEDRSEIDFGFFHDQLKAHNIQSLDVRGQDRLRRIQSCAPRSGPGSHQSIHADKIGDKSATASSEQPTTPLLLKKKFTVGFFPPGVDAELRKGIARRRRRSPQPPASQPTSPISSRSFGSSCSVC